MTKRRACADGTRGGTPWTKGAVYKILANKIYVGHAVHRGAAYPGEHAAIIEQRAWDKAHAVTAEPAHRRTAAPPRPGARVPALLKGLIFGPHGRPMSPSHSRRREGGIVAACQWDFRRGMPMSLAIREVFDVVVSDVCESLGKRQATALASEAELRQHWEAAGLTDVETARLVTTLSYASFDDLWQPLLTPVSAAVAALPPDAREEVHRRLRERLLGESRHGSFSLAAEAFAVRGQAVRQAGPR